MTIATDCVMPKNLLPIILIGAGGIVNDAHLPAYKIAGFWVAGIYDPDREKALRTAKRFDIPLVYYSMEDMLARSPRKVVFDVAVPGSEILSVLQQLPQGAIVLIQKPMGTDYAMAKAVLAMTRTKQMTAGVNFQLRYAPYVNAARDIIRQGLIGDVCDIEINVNVLTPWHLWQFLYATPRVEIVYHSIHYLDLIRSFLGNPDGIYAKTVRHPGSPGLASVRTSMILDYGDNIRANILTNHNHVFGLRHQHSYIKLEGTRGAVKIRMGSLINYPEGAPDSFEYVLLEDGQTPVWKTLDISGSWLPHAFIGTMAQMMLAAEGSIRRPDNSVEDCIDTMACVEAAYTSSAQGGVKLPVPE